MDKKSENAFLQYEFDKYALECELALNVAKVRIENTMRKIAADPSRNNPFDRLEYRLKSFNSTVKKCKRKGYNLDIEDIKKNVKDVAGIRVITIFRDEIYQVADEISQIPGVAIVSVEDYIKNPKSNGYTSLHLDVLVENYFPGEGSKLIPVEIQIRDKAMNLWASVEHIVKYKKDNPDPQAEAYFGEMSEFISKFDDVAMQLRDYGKVIEVDKASVKINGLSTDEIL